MILSNGMMVTTIRYCGGFLNAMDDAKEGAPVFAKVILSKLNDFQSSLWMIFPICQRPCCTVAGAGQCVLGQTSDWEKREGH